ncbi:transferrin-binding protein-like solute binding protein [Yoonia sp. 2307UL14-13]|uniref:transferrin-binding protein-like solute binding protein n=1 Tax=Yoonia sp. 2307UL14-13 TaxID=3126506 RepID=UPI0030AB4061
MTYPATRTLLLTLAALGLAACGSGGGGGGGAGTGGTPPGGGGGTPPPTVAPIASVGFASATNDFSDGGTTFTTATENLIYFDQTASTIVEDDTITISFSDDLERVFITRGNRGSGFNRVSGTDRYLGDRPDVTIFDPVLTADNQDARLAFLGDTAIFVRGHPNFVVYGFDTDPADIPASGSANFTGDVRASYAPIRPGINTTADGTFTLTADFVNSRVDGNMTIEAISASGTGQGSTAWTMNDADITANGFSGTLTNDTSVDAVDPDTTVNAANYDGRFYGVDADAVGGHFLIELTDGGEDAYIYGAFLGDED